LALVAKILPDPTGEPLRLVDVAAPVTDQRKRETSRGVLPIWQAGLGAGVIFAASGGKRNSVEC